MSLGRDELAHAYHMRLLETYPHNPEVAVRRAIQHADALLEALSSKPALAPPPAAAPVAYVPRPGDVIAWKWETDTEAEATYVRVVAGHDRWVGVASGAIHDDLRDEPIGGGARYLRPATPAERAAAGLPVEPVAAPVEAKRPTWVRYRSAFSGSWCEPCPVLGWEGETPQVKSGGGSPVALTGYNWEPCTPPSPEAPDARGEWRDNWPAAITEQLRIDGHAPLYNAAFVRLVAERVIAARGAS